MATIALTRPEEIQAAQQAVASTDLITCGLTQRLLKCENDDQNTIGGFLGRAKVLQEDIQAFMLRCQTDRVAELQANIEAASEEGRIAEQELARANAGVMNARLGDANRSNAYEAAALKLKTAKEAPLGTFYGAADEAAKSAAIVLAQAELDAALADLQAHPLAIPTAINNEEQAKRKVAALAGRVKGYRRELAALTGKPEHSVGSPQSAYGLVG